MLTAAATKQHTYPELLAALYPMAASVTAQVDQEMTVFGGTVHRDHLDDYWALLKEMLLEPKFDEADLARIRANAVTGVDVGLRRSDDEETGKEVLLGAIFHEHPYGHPPQGKIEDLRSITIDDVRAFYREQLRADNLRTGLAGGFPPGFAQRADRELRSSLPGPADDREAVAVPPAPAIERNRMLIVEKPTRATGLHMGFPLDVERGDPDWVALWLARSFLGEHRSENSYLYQRLREIRGLNYGDYAYLEYFPNGGARFRPEPNIARSRQVFQVWIRPVPAENGPFALKAAWYELDKLVKNGLTKAQFEATRDYLSKSVAMLVQTDDRRLGYALDSEFYGMPDFVDYVRDGLPRLTVEDVNRAIATHLRSDRLQFVVVADDANAFRTAILGPEPTSITYQAEPGPEILAEDAVIEKIRLQLRPEDIAIVPIDEVFAR
jgi:zinc protease